MGRPRKPKPNRMPCDPNDGRLLLGMTFAQIERMDRAVEKIRREEAEAKRRRRSHARDGTGPSTRI
jgi:hypothetical protein